MSEREEKIRKAFEVSPDEIEGESPEDRELAAEKLKQLGEFLIETMTEPNETPDNASNS